MELDRDVQLAFVLLGIVVVGGLLLWAIRKKASAWADQYNQAVADEARGTQGDYPAIGYRAQRLSWRQVIFYSIFLAVVTAVIIYFDS